VRPVDKNKLQAISEAPPKKKVKRLASSEGSDGSTEDESSMKNPKKTCDPSAPQAQAQGSSAPQAQVQGSSAPQVVDEEAELPVSGPVALVLTPEHLQEKITLPYHNYEGRSQPIALDTETLLCSGAKVPPDMVPRACYVYGVVCVSGKTNTGPYRYRTYFDPWVVLPRPVPCAKAWGQFCVQVSKTKEHMDTFLQVKHIVAGLLKTPMLHQLPQPCETEEMKLRMDSLTAESKILKETIDVRTNSMSFLY